MYATECVRVRACVCVRVCASADNQNSRSTLHVRRRDIIGRPEKEREREREREREERERDPVDSGGNWFRGLSKTL